MFDLDFLIRSPSEFVDFLAQNIDNEGDFGINRCLLECYKQNNNCFDGLDQVSTMSDYMEIIPGKLTKFRCCLAADVATEYFPLRVFSEGKYHTPFLNGSIPEDIYEQIPIMSERRIILAFSVHSMASWMRKEILPKKNDPHLAESESNNPEIDSDDSMLANIKVAFDYNVKPFHIVDVIGVFENLPEHDISSDTFFHHDGFSSSLPTFIGLCIIPIRANIPYQMTYNTRDVYQGVFSFFNQYFGLMQTEMLMLWLAGRVTHRIGEIPFGLFSLNLFGVSCDNANSIYSILESVCSYIAKVNLNVASFNRQSLKPKVIQNDIHNTVFLSPTETRYIVDETSLDVGNFNEVGTENLNLIKKLMDDQSLSYYIEKADYEIPVSCPVLSLSISRSVLKCQVSIPLGETKEIPDSNSIADLDIIRHYIERIRFHEANPSETNGSIMHERLISIMNECVISQESLQLLYLLALLKACLVGENDISEEIWETTVNLFMFIEDSKSTNIVK